MKTIDTDAGLALYKYIDEYEKEVGIDFRTLDGPAHQRTDGTLGMHFDHYKCVKQIKESGYYCLIGHEFQHTAESIAFDMFNHVHSDRPPTTHEWQELSNPVLNVDNEFHLNHENDEQVVYKNWLGQKVKGKLATAVEARAVRVQNIIMLQYRTKHDLPLVSPADSYESRGTKEGAIYMPIPLEFQNFKYKQFIDDTLNFQREHGVLL